MIRGFLQALKSSHGRKSSKELEVQNSATRERAVTPVPLTPKNVVAITVHGRPLRVMNCVNLKTIPTIIFFGENPARFAVVAGKAQAISLESLAIHSFKGKLLAMSLTRPGCSDALATCLRRPTSLNWWVPCCKLLHLWVVISRIDVEQA